MAKVDSKNISASAFRVIIETVCGGIIISVMMGDIHTYCNSGGHMETSFALKSSSEVGKGLYLV